MAGLGRLIGSGRGFRMRELKDRVALVTGASSGIGEACARRLARERMPVALVARRAPRLAAIAAEIEAAGGRALALPADLLELDRIPALVEAVLARWGRIDVLINNAAMPSGGRLAALDPARVERALRLNLTAAIGCARAVVPAMRRQGEGVIVNVSSIAGLVAPPGSAVYSAAKFGLVGFSEALGRELRPDGIRVVALCPGFVATHFSPLTAAVAEGRPDAPRLPAVMRAEAVAEHILRLIRRPRRRAVLPPAAAPLVALAAALPGLTDRAIRRFIGGGPERGRYDGS